MVQLVSLIIFNLIVIYPVGSAIQLLNNWGLSSKNAIWLPNLVDCEEDASSNNCLTTNQAPVVQMVDSTTHWINLYHCITQLVSPNTYPHDSDLSGGQFVHLWPGSGKIMLISCEFLVTNQKITLLGSDTKL